VGKRLSQGIREKRVRNKLSDVLPILEDLRCKVIRLIHQPHLHNLPVTAPDGTVSGGCYGRGGHGST